MIIYPLKFYFLSHVVYFVQKKRKHISMYHMTVEDCIPIGEVGRLFVVCISMVSELNEQLNDADLKIKTTLDYVTKPHQRRYVLYLVEHRT